MTHRKPIQGYCCNSNNTAPSIGTIVGWGLELSLWSKRVSCSLKERANQRWLFVEYAQGGSFNFRKWSWLTMFNSLFSLPTFLLFSPFRLVRSNTWVQWKHLAPERSIDLCIQTFPKLLLLLVSKVTTRSLYPEYIANLKLPIDAFSRKSLRR